MYHCVQDSKTLKGNYAKLLHKCDQGIFRYFFLIFCFSMDKFLILVVSKIYKGYRLSNYVYIMMFEVTVN